MKKKNKIILYVIAIIFILLVGGIAGGFVGNEIGKKDSTCSTSTTNNYIEGSCDDGGRYRCTTTCVDIPPTRPIPTGQENCEDYASKNNYQNFYYGTSITSEASCRTYLYANGCTAPMNFKAIDNCCLWNCQI